MSTRSFDKAFVVSNEANVQKFKAKSTSPHKPILVKPRDVKEESKKGVELLKNCW